jgi:predicted O-methyltransferase YrrM
MRQETWTAVDRYMVESLIPSDPILEAVLQANAAAGLPAHDVAPNQGKLLYLLAKIHGAKRILEIGTLGAYSTIWLGRALPEDGFLVTLEREAKHAAVATANLERAALPCQVDLRVGPALDSLEQLVREGAAPFDLIFIDADKPNNPAYLEWSMRLARVGTIIVGDNVVRDGAVIDARSGYERVQGVREFFAMMSGDARLDATALQTVGSKGYDGFTLAVVRALA